MPIDVYMLEGELWLECAWFNNMSNSSLTDSYTDTNSS